MTQERLTALEDVAALATIGATYPELMLYLQAEMAKCEQALAAQPEQHPVWTGCGECDSIFPCTEGQTRCIRLKQPDQTYAAEVTSWIMFDSSLGKRVKLLNQDLPLGTKLYTASNVERQCKWPTCQNEEYQQALAEQIKQELVTGKPWVGLTEKEIWEIHDRCIPPTEGYVSPVDFARAIEAKLKERNNG